MTVMSAPKQRRKWPQGAEWARRDAMNAAEEARALLRGSIVRISSARERLARDPTDPRADAELADAIANQAQALALLADIQRLLTEARIGRED